MQPSVRIVLGFCFLLFAALTAQAADPQPATIPAAQPAVSTPVAPAATPAQPALKPAPGLSLLSAAKETPQPVALIKIGVVDINKVSAGTVMGKTAQSQIKSQQARLQKQGEAKRKQLDKFKAETERQLPSLSPQQREAKSKEFQKKIEEFQKFGMKAEKELMENQQKLTKNLIEAISKAAEELGKAKGMSAIVVNRELLFLGVGIEPIELTDDLIKLIDEKGAKK
jgi:outer membrane protein